MNNGNSNNNNNRNNSNRVRAVASADDKVAYDISLDSIVEAFEDCCRNKKTSKDYLQFLPNYQTEIVRVWEDIRHGRYTPGKSKCFVVEWPVHREVFAADFSDRIVHHWWSLRVNPLLEQRFIEQGDVSKNCRVGHGVHSAVKDARKMVDEHPDWWVGRFDIEGFFMSMDKALLYEMLDIFIRDNYKGDDLQCLLYITRVIVFHCPQDNCIRRSNIEKWSHIPPRKTLFGQPKEKGCAIGNLPSQEGANFYLSILDFYILEIKKCKLYIRFVDDFIVFMETREELVALVPELNNFLNEQLLVNLHPKKIYIQPVRNGVLFVGAMIRPGRTYISNRTRGKMYNKLRFYNKMAEEGKALQFLDKFVASMNSYLGMMVHYRTFKIRRKVYENTSPIWWQYVYMANDYKKYVIKKQYRPLEISKKKVKSGAYRNILMPELFSK